MRRQPGSHFQEIASDAPKPRPWLRRSFRALRVASIVAPWLFVGIVAWRARPYYLDVASQGSLHAAAAMMLLAIALLAFRRFLGAASYGLAALVIAMLWSTWARSPAALPVGTKGWMCLKLVHYNAFAHASRHDDRFAAWLEAENPDIVVIVDSPWRYVDAQAWLAARYPYRIEPDPSFEWPMTVLSKLPLAPASELFEFPTTDRSAIYSFTAQRAPALTLPDGQRILLSAMHPPSPRRERSWTASLRIAYREALLIHAWREGTGLGVVLSGDCNSTPVGRVHRTFRMISGLTGWSTLLGSGTWPANYSPWISIPIDRVWTSDEMVVRSLQVGPQFASDHRPLVAEICIPPRNRE